MGKGVEDGAIDKACTECSRVCQTTHGKGLPHSVPKFFKAISEYSTPSSSSCNLQIPAAYIRNHIGVSKKEKYVLEGAQGCEWVVTFNNVAFKTGWKEFATDYQLQKGDGIMLSLIAPKKFYVDVFDKFGVEKVSTKQPRASPSTVISKENHVAASTSGGGAENECTPLGLDHTNLHKEGESNGILHHPLAEVPNSDAGCAPTSGQNGDHDKRILIVDKHHLPVGHLAEPSTMSESSDDSDDAIDVRLAKAVLAKAKQKKLKKQKKNKKKTSCTSPPPVETAPEGTTTKSEATLEAEACKSLQNEDRALYGTSLSRDVDPTDSPRNDGTTSLDEAMFENPCAEEQPRVLIIAASNDEVTGHERNELQTDQPGKMIQEEAPLPHQVPSEPENATEEGLPLKRVEVNPAGDGPRPVFLPSLVKLEPGLLSPDLGPAIKDPHPPTCVKCTNCGKMKDAINRPLKSEPITTESPEARSLEVRSPEVRSPTSNAPSVTEYQKQQALAAAKELSANTMNPNAIVVMRISMSKKTYDCFLSVKCSEMLPSVPTELTLMDMEGKARRANWRPDQRYMDGPGWKDFVDSHNLQINDACVMEVINSSEQNFVVKVHILHAHEMERSPEPQAAIPAPVPPALAAGAPKTLEVAKTLEAAKPPAVPVPVGLGTKTRSSNLLHGVSPRTSKRTRTPTPTRNLEQQPEIPRPSATTADDQALIELTRPSPVKRPRRRSSSSPSTPRPRRDSAPPTREEPQQQQANKPARVVKQKVERRQHTLYVPHVVQKKAKPEVVGVAAKGGGGASSQSASLVQLRNSGNNTDEANVSVGVNPKPKPKTKQVRTRNSQKLHYKVAKVLDRRKSLQGSSFLVELREKVSPESIHKRMKARQDSNGRWWVPQNHFNQSLSSCYIE